MPGCTAARTPPTSCCCCCCMRASSALIRLWAATWKPSSVSLMCAACASPSSPSCKRGGQPTAGLWLQAERQAPRLNCRLPRCCSPCPAASKGQPGTVIWLPSGCRLVVHRHPWRRPNGPGSVGPVARPGLAETRSMPYPPLQTARLKTVSAMPARQRREKTLPPIIFMWLRPPPPCLLLVAAQRGSAVGGDTKEARPPRQSKASPLPGSFHGFKDSSD